MEIPCKLTFMTASETEYMKTRKLVNDALSVELSSENMYNASIVPSPAEPKLLVKIWMVKFWRLQENPPNPPKYSPSKILCYTVASYSSR